MRFIDLTKLERPAGWDDTARQAADEVAQASPDDRPALINRKSRVWSSLKPAMERLSGKKCWYCEARQERSDKAVDHFRPKNRVQEDGCMNHPGYWWLAFCWKNYRYCCTYCNSRHVDAEGGTAGGKWDRFPLADETRRCAAPEGVLDEEQPVLLDPTRRADPLLLWIDEDGRAQPKFSETAAPWPHRRARESIDIYHLDHVDVREARLAVCAEAKRRVQEVDEAWRLYAPGSAVGEDRFVRAVDQVAELLTPTAEYSAAAKCTVRGMISADRPWLEELLGAL